jgi:hypothetical protein
MEKRGKGCPNDLFRGGGGKLRPSGRGTRIGLRQAPCISTYAVKSYESHFTGRGRGGAKIFLEFPAGADPCAEHEGERKEENRQGWVANT